MRVQINYLFFDAINTSMESNSLLNTYGGSQLVLQVEGDATSFSLEVQGIVDDSTKVYRPLAIISNTDFAVSNVISKKGIYTIGVDGINEIKLNLSSISGGALTVFGKLGE